MTEVLRHVAVEVQLDHNNPWPGLASYDESSHEFFSGRAAEAADLRRRILDEPVTVLFGKSGLGKSSLLKAGVFPGLREKDLLPVLVRLQIRPGAEPLMEQVRLALVDELRARQIDHGENRAGETLWEYLHTIGQEFWTKQNRLMRPVFVLDQFEELFTLGRAVPNEVQAFREDLADLAENRIPEAVARRLEESPTSEPGLNLQAMPYKVVLALREDFLADLEGWRLTMPSLRRNRMRLLPMGPDQALKAVHNERTQHLVSEEIARKIVTFLASSSAEQDEEASPDSTGPTIEPALLSLFCRGVNEHRKRDHKGHFDMALLEGGKGTIVLDFYRSSLVDQAPRVRQFIEEELITEHGYRNSYSVEDALARGAVTTTALDTLINRHLLRYEHHLGAERVELTHDLLTGAVLDEREARRQAERAQRERRQRWRLGGIAATLALVALVFLALAIRASRAEMLANVERDRSRSRELAALAGTQMNRDPELAIALGLEALRRADTSEARSALLDAGQYVWPSAELGKDQLKDTPTAIALSADGSRLAVLSGDRAITLWDVSSRHPSQVWKEPADLTDATSVAVSPDRLTVAVGRKASIDLVNAETGKVERTLPRPEVGDRRVLFSPDGRWLASTLDAESLQLLDYHDSKAQPVRIDAKDAMGFAVVSGTRIITVAVSPLAAYAHDLQPNGKWKLTPFDLSSCMTPQSVSPGSEYVSATWRAHACTFDADSSLGVNEGTADRATDDIIWSPGGRASAELLVPQGPFSQDLIVGRNLSGQLASRIKGAHLDSGVNEKSRLIAVDESGTRVALIDEDEHKLVRIYFLAGHKPFLSRFESGSYAMSPDHTWIAVARPGATEGTATVDVVPIDQSFSQDQLLNVRTRIVVGALPTALYATESSVVAVTGNESVTTSVFDAATGKRRFDPLPGRAQPIGATGELLLFGPSGGSMRAVKTRDGSTVAPWEQLPDAGNSRVAFRLSPRKHALVVIRPSSPDQQRARALVYSIRGDSLVLAGYVRDLPSSAKSFAVSRLTPADDAKTVTDTRANLVWPVMPESGEPQPPKPLETISNVASPKGGFEVQQEAGPGDSPAPLTVIRRADKSVVRRFTTNLVDHRFSDDDRWLAVWGEDAIQVLDLSRGEVTFNLTYSNIEAVEFVVNNSIVTLHLSESTILVPLDLPLTERFANWLTPRKLTPQERDKYGLLIP